MTCTIYKITNSINTKIYIGQTWDMLSTRFSAHLSPSSRGCSKLYRAFEKYGRENFKIEEICQVDNQEDANSLESFLIQSRDTIKNGYNLRSGGSHGKHSEESKIKMSKSKKGIKPSKETLVKLSKARMGNQNARGSIRSQEFRDHVSAQMRGTSYHLGRKLTEEHKQKISVSMKIARGK